MQSGGRIIGIENEKIILSTGEFRSRYLAQEKESINGKIIRINISNGDYKIILEVNSSPGTENIEKANNKNIVKDVLSYFSDTKVRYTIPNECGWEEVVTIKPFGDLTAKFDTGNSGMPVLHAEDIKVNGKKITFTTNNKTITTKLVGTYTTVTGAGQDDRYIAELEFEFAGSNYGKVQFGLDNRDDLSTDVLLNRKLMRLLNVMVNPQRNYLITTPMSLDK